MIHKSVPGIEYFKPFKVKLLVDVYTHKKGTIVNAEFIPNGLIYLHNVDDCVFFTDAKEGETFVKI